MAIKRLLILVLLCSSAFAVTRTVKKDGTGTCTVIQTCVNLMSASGGDTTTVFAGTYAENITLVAGASSAAYNVTQVNGSDVVKVLSVTYASFAKFGPGFTITNPNAPNASACVTFPQNTTDMYLTNDIITACGNGAMISLINVTTRPSLVRIQGNTISYGCMAPGDTFQNVCQAVNAFGNDILFENNDVSHVIFVMDRGAGSRTYGRNNNFHDMLKTDCNPSLGAVGNVSGTTVNWVSGGIGGQPFLYQTFVNDAWIAVNGTKVAVTSVNTGTYQSMTIGTNLGTLTNATLTGGGGGNCHFDTLFSEPGAEVPTQFIIWEGNTATNSVGDNNKLLLAQGDACANQCSYLIARGNVAAHFGAGMIEDDAADATPIGFHHVKVYNNTFADIDILNLSVNGATSGFTGYSTNGAYLNNIHYFVGSTSTGINPVVCDFGSPGSTCATFSNGGNIAWMTGTGPVCTNTGLYGQVYQAGCFTDIATNLNADPKFTNYAANDFTLAVGSPGLQAGVPLTTIAAGDSGAGTTLVVTDAAYFQPGNAALAATILGDGIAVGTTNCSLAAGHTATITAINYATNTITTDVGLTRANADKVCLWKNSSGTQVLFNTKSDIGAFQAGAGAPTCTLSASPTVIKTGTSSTLTFTPANTPTTCSIDNGVGSVSCLGATPSVSPTTLTTYTATVSNAGGSGTCTATVTIGGIKQAANTIRTANTIIQ